MSEESLFQRVRGRRGHWTKNTVSQDTTEIRLPPPFPPFVCSWVRVRVRILGLGLGLGLGIGIEIEIVLGLELGLWLGLGLGLG